VGTLDGKNQISKSHASVPCQETEEIHASDNLQNSLPISEEQRIYTQTHTFSITPQTSNKQLFLVFPIYKGRLGITHKIITVLYYTVRIHSDTA
jgi:hypothetical protein